MQETLYIGQWYLSPLQSRHLGTSQSPSAALLYFPKSHWQSEISSLSKVILVLGKARSHRAPSLGCRGAESPGWFGVSLKNSAWDMIRGQTHSHDEAAHHQEPRAAAFWIIQIVPTEEHSSFMGNLMQVRCSTCSVILNSTAPRYTCSLMVSTAPTD